jgi:hypothetical protein
MLEVYWRDNVKAREQRAEGTYVRVPTGDPRVNAQAFFLEQAARVRCEK